jgi:hypothetical protein
MMNSDQRPSDTPHVQILPDRLWVPHLSGSG